MKKILVSAKVVFQLLLLCSSTNAQNVFPSTGRVGIYTTSPATSLQVRGGARIGTTANYVNIDSATGNLSFVGTSAYRVAGNKYAFQYAGNTNYGLFFNSTNVQYEFRNGSAVPVFSVNANTGNSVFNGTLKVGAYTLPATDGTSGQVLKTNGAGVVTWSADNTGGSGSGWSLTGNAGTNSATNFVGTTDNRSLRFRTQNIQRVIIDSLGNMGIGTATPTSELEVHNGALTISSNTSANLIINANASAIGNSNQILFADNGATKWALGGSNIGSAGANDFSLYNYNLGSNALTISKSNNNVGIGTTTPGNKLHVFNGSAGSVTGYINAPLIVENSTHSFINILAPDASETGILFGKPAGNTSGGIIYNNSDNQNGFQFRTNGNITQMVLTNTGKLGLGMTPFNSLDITNPNATHGIVVRNTYQGSSGLFGIWADSQQGSGSIGVLGVGGSTGVRGDAFDYTTTGTAYGIVGQAFGTNGIGNRYGVWGFAAGGAVNYAGYFEGDVFTTGSYLPSARVLKEDIRPLKDGLQQLLQLKPSTYRYKTSEYKQMALPEGKQMGLIADEVKQVFPELIKTAVQPEQHDREDRTKIISPEVKFEALNYVGLIPVLIASVQELSKMNDEKDVKIDNLQKQINELKAIIVSNQSSVNSQQSISFSSSSLEQNIPNPFSNTTTINYTLPQKFTSAQIVITDKSGKALRTINVSGSGKGSLNVAASTLAAGAYQYSLIIDGKLIAARQMVLAR